MLKITLPDGSQKTFENPVSVHQVAEKIGAGLARAAIAGKVDGKLVDTSYLIEQDATLAIITEKSPEALEVIRHSAAHVLAQAVKQLFPSAQVTIGPVIEDGFYYDFSFERPFTLDDLSQIEKKMREIVKADQPVTRSTLPRDKAIQFFREMGEEYKAKIIEDIPDQETLSLYQQGDFTDLCRGPHVPSTGKVKAFKLMKLAGAYWRGDSKNEMLQRIYGTAWTTKEDLESYLHRLEEAERRDHRRLAKQMDLFHIQEESPGMVFWHEKGWTIYLALQHYIRALLQKSGYQEVRTPQLVDRSLWERSGHWEKFHSDMFITETENRVYAVKPMNCPCHVQIFNHGLKSYRDLPLRLAEFGNCHRAEPSGSLHGLMRVRNFVQDDGHIFCTESQIQAEVSAFIDTLIQVYQDLGFSEIIYRLSTRPQNRLGSEESWDKAEQALEAALNHRGVAWELNPGEGAFYGPKIEFSLKDCLNRVWQCGTIQVDFSMPGRLGASYIDEQGNKQIPVMLHRAILGTFERFMGILLEHHAQELPLWLSPIHLVVMNITSNQSDYSSKIAENLKNKGFRVISDLRNEKIGYKIREHTLQRIPYLVVLGDREMEAQSLAVRKRNGDDLGAMPLEQFVERLSREIANHQ